MRRSDPRLWISLVLALTIAPILGLISLYHLGLWIAPPLPPPPGRLLDTDEAQRVFAEADWQDELALQPVGLRSVARVLACESLSPLRDPRPCRARTPGVIAAARAAQLHLTRSGAVGWRRELAAGSTTVWISRHWTAEQIAAYLDTPAP